MVAEKTIAVSKQDLASMNNQDLDTILYMVDQAIEAMDDNAGDQSYTLEVVDTGKLQVGYFSELDGITGDLQSGKIDLATYDKKMHSSIHTNFTKVYEANRGAPLDAGDLEYLKRATAQEMGYARKFGTDIQNETLRMPRERRTGMYAQTLQGIGDHAKVEAAPLDSEFIWRLGEAEHCPDCLVLSANNPYTKLTLPTTPRAGATVCLSNCRCKLIIQEGKLSKTQVAELKDLDLRKDQSLQEVMTPPTPPKGMRVPNESEQKWIDNKRMQVNTNRRIIGTSTDKDKIQKAIAARKEANAELIEFLDNQSIYEVPVWSVDDVLEGRHVGRRVVRDIMRHGIDGKSLGMVEKKQLASLLSEYEKRTGLTLSDSAIDKALKET